MYTNLAISIHLSCGNVGPSQVALIDDGVDLSNVDMYGGIVNISGLSFHPSDRPTENPWHTSSGGHGTVMANMILRINPWVELFVIRLHCTVGHNQQRIISARSAAEALRAAIALKVNIISASWTIDNPKTSALSNESGPSKRVKDGLTQFKEAIDEVKKHGILMFCSASDDIQTAAMSTLPYCQQPEHIFRIGAALWLGQRDPKTEAPDRNDWVSIHSIFMKQNSSHNFPPRYKASANSYSTTVLSRKPGRRGPKS